MYIVLVDNVYDEIVSQSFRIVKTKLEALYWFQYEIDKLNVYSDIQHPYNFYTYF